jgi:hypothetical protein
MTARVLAWRQLAVTIAILSVFFLFPSWIPGDWARSVAIAVQVLVYTLGVGFLFRHWRR